MSLLHPQTISKWIYYHIVPYVSSPVHYHRFSTFTNCYYFPGQSQQHAPFRFHRIHPTNFSLDSQFLHATMHSLSLTPLGSQLFGSFLRYTSFLINDNAQWEKFQVATLPAFPPIATSNSHHYPLDHHYCIFQFQFLTLFFSSRFTFI